MAINDYFKMQRVINGLDLSRPVYKYIPLKYVITMLKTQKLYVGKVKKWGNMKKSKGSQVIEQL